MPAISVLMKPSSGMCNMSCDYCFYRDEMQKRMKETYGFMSEQTLKNVIRKTLLKAEGSISYAFQGGEPMLRGIEFFQKAVSFEKQYNKNNIKVLNSLQTNGYLIDEQWCKFFKENDFLVGVSVDGTQEIHDRYRHTRLGQGTFDRIYRNTKLLDRYGVDYNILTVVTQETARNIADIYKFYKKCGWQYQQYIACLEPIDDERGKYQYAVSPEQYGEFLIELFELWYADYQKGSQPYIRQFDNYIGILLGYWPESCEQRGTCGIQNVVEADGSVYPCDFYVLDDYLLGNLNHNTLDDINEKRKEIQFLERSVRLSDQCKECRFLSLCRGGCQRNREYSCRDNGYVNYFCKSYEMFFSACIDKMKLLAENMINKN